MQNNSALEQECVYTLEHSVLSDPLRVHENKNVARDSISLYILLLSGIYPGEYKTTFRSSPSSKMEHVFLKGERPPAFAFSNKNIYVLIMSSSYHQLKIIFSIPRIWATIWATDRVTTSTCYGPQMVFMWAI